MTIEGYIDFFFKPESIALIGASPNPKKLSDTILESLLKMGFQGKIYLVNPGYQEIRGLKCYPTSDEISGRYEAYKATFRKASIIEEVESYEELKDACKVLNRYQLAEGKRILIITDGGGIGISIADTCEEAGLKVPEITSEVVRKLKEKLPAFASVRNPVDLTSTIYGILDTVFTHDSSSGRQWYCAGRRDKMRY